jgi:hypothetical protein
MNLFRFPTTLYPQLWGTTIKYVNTEPRKPRVHHLKPKKIRHRTHIVPDNEDRCIAITQTGEQCKLYKKKKNYEGHYCVVHSKIHDEVPIHVPVSKPEPDPEPDRTNGARCFSLWWW